MKKFLLIVLLFLCMGAKWSITYRVDEKNQRGKPQKTIVTADTSAEAKENFRESHPKATIISITEKRSH